MPKSQVTVDLKINADAQIKNAQKFKQQVQDIFKTSNFNFDDDYVAKITTALSKMDVAIKQLKKGTKEGVLLDNKEIENIVKAGNTITKISQEIANSFSSKMTGLVDFNDELNNAKQKLEEMKKAYKQLTGVSFNPEDVKNYEENLQKTITALKETKKQSEQELTNQKNINAELEKNTKLIKAKAKAAQAQEVLAKGSQEKDEKAAKKIYGSYTGATVKGSTRETVERDLQKQLSTIDSETARIKTKYEEKYQTEIADITAKIEQAETTLNVSQKQHSKIDTQQAAVESLTTQITESSQFKTVQSDTQVIEEVSQDSEQLGENLGKAARQSLYLGDTFAKFKDKASYFISMNFVFDQVISKMREAVQVTSEMDKDMTQIGLVLGQTAGRVWENFDTYSSMATRLNTTTSEVTGAMKLFYQQGLNTAQVNKMVEASAIAAALGETSLSEASETLTSVINSYSLSARDAMDVTDKISQVAISSASDFNEISTAIEKVASSAANAGLDLDHLMGYLGKMIETTR